LGQPCGFTAFRTQRGEFKEGGDRVSVFQQHALRVWQILHPREQIDKGWRDGVQRLFVGQCGGLAALHGRAGFGDACFTQGLHMALPDIRLFGFHGFIGCIRAA